MNSLQNASPAALDTKRFPTRQPRCAFEHRSYPEHRITPHRLFNLSRMQYVQDPLIRRHAAADSEDEHANHECPEVEFMPVSKRMIRIRWLATLVKSEQ